MKAMTAMKDTPDHIEEMMRERFAALTGSERFMMGISMCATARQIVLASFPPGLSPLETKIRLAERYYGDEPELVRKFVEHLRKVDARENPEG
jgi:hypothetical protein